MKNLKKIFVIVMAITMMSGLVACGGETSDDKDVSKNNVNTEVNSENVENEPIVEAEVGALLDAPEKMFNLEKFYALISFPDDTNESGISTREIIMDDTSTPGIVYLTSGLLKLDEYIYEMGDDGSLTIYYKDVFMEDYVLLDSMTDEEIQTEKNYVYSQLAWIGWSSDVFFEGVKYKKCENDWNAFWGDVFVYEMIYDDEVLSKIYVDMETGVWVKEELDGVQNMSVTMFREDDLGIPEYK